VADEPVTDPGQRVPNPLDIAPQGVCIICGEELLRTVEVQTASGGGIRIQVVHWLECGCGRRPA
jgi:hypothetical protein